MATTSDIKNGLCIELNNDIYEIIEFLHVKPGKGNAFVRTKLKSINTGKVIEHTFPAGHKIFPVRVERRPFQFLYKDDSTYHFMNTKTYEQISINENYVKGAQFLKEGQELEIVFKADDETILYSEMPPNVILEVVYTEPGIKGDTVTNATKNAKLETGAEIKVPLFINTGDKIKVNTKTGEYIERVN